MKPDEVEGWLVIFIEAAEFEQWLTDDDAAPMLRPLPENGLTFGPVNEVVNNAWNTKMKLPPKAASRRPVTETSN